MTAAARSRVADLLLVLGTVAAAIAAAGSARAWRWLDLAPGAAHPGEVLFADVLADDAPLARAGDPLDAERARALAAAGVARVRVKDPARDREALPGGDPAALEGRVLAADVRLGSREETVPAGRRLTDALVDRLEAAGVASVAVAAPEDGGAARELDLAAARAALADDAELDLAEPVTLVEPDVLPAGAFLDGPRALRIAEAGVDEVEVAIRKRFSLGGWDQSWLFALGVLAMAAGVGTKRFGGGAAAVALPASGGRAAGATALRAELAALVDAVAALEPRLPELSADELHAQLDPLLTGPLYRFVEGRAALAAERGVAGYARTMSPFAAGERQLNRAWSAAVDGHGPEARASVARALPPLREALETLDAG